MSVALATVCPSHPGIEWVSEWKDGEEHECMADEMRCVYCGVRLDPYPCNGCGKFLTAKQMHAASVEGANYRCEDCA